MKHRMLVTAGIVCSVLAGCAQIESTPEMAASDYMASLKGTLAGHHAGVFVMPLGVRQYSDDPYYIVVDLAIVGDAVESERLARILRYVLFFRPEEFLEIRDANMRPVRIDKDVLLRDEDSPVVTVRFSDEAFYSESIDGERNALIEPINAALNPARHLRGVVYARLNSQAIVDLAHDFHLQQAVAVDDRWLEAAVAHADLLPR